MKIITYQVTDPDAAPSERQVLAVFEEKGVVLPVFLYGPDVPTTAIAAEKFWTSEVGRQRRLSMRSDAPRDANGDVMTEARIAGLAKAREAAAAKRLEKKAAGE